MGRSTKKELRALLEYIKRCHATCDSKTFAQRVSSRLAKTVIAARIQAYGHNPHTRPNSRARSPSDALTTLRPQTVGPAHVHQRLNGRQDKASTSPGPPAQKTPDARNEPTKKSACVPPYLSPREAEVLQWIALGKTNKETGMILNLSPRTVQKHLEHIYQKLGVETRTGAAAKIHEYLTNSGSGK